MSYTQLLYHIVFRTKNSSPAITEAYERQFYTYVWGFLRNHECVLYRIGGMPDHVHLLIQTPANVLLVNLIRDLKAGSSRFLREHKHEFPHFSGWGKSYCALSVSAMEKEKVISYIMGQKEHHKKLSIKDELVNIFRENGIEYEEDYICSD